ncbi:oligoendopeptidase F [[Mycoplasma] testudinis]|uniref:oligoendopeptidase F n=1 Tax=[Mycoplasma] testudinis TaxID=33924 RepID=UPI000698C23F|nr:oligoendopeptidase F [[Mycoplasma] testudinis]
MKKQNKNLNSTNLTENKNNKYSWDLDAILEGGTLEDLYQKWLKAKDSLLNVYNNGAFAFKEDSFAAYLKADKTLKLLTNRLINYIFNNLNEDITNPVWAGWQQKFMFEVNQLQQAMSQLSKVIVKNKDNIKKYLALPKYKNYQREFDLVFRTEPHILKEDEEQLMAKLSLTNETSEDIFNTLTRSEIKFQDAISSTGKKYPIKTMSDVAPLLKSKDRKLRKSAWLSEFGAFYNFRNTLSKTLYYAYLKYNTLAKVRNYKNYVSQTAFDDEINEEFISFIYEQVAAFAPIVKKYNSLRNAVLRKKLNTKNIYPWDLQIPLFNQNTKYSIEEAKKIALAALKPMGEEYQKVVKQAFGERWVSWLSKPGKQTGAYSIGNAEGLQKYYISMNFDTTLRSVYTIIHELGHSMHTWSLLNYQKIYTDVSIFYAEVASIANEMLLNYHLLKEFKNDSKMKISILMEMINNFFATTTRQIMFSNFEYIANEKINSGQQFSSEVAYDIYATMHEKYLGFSKSAVKRLKTSTYGKKSLAVILAVPHFYSGIFYVYKYAVGQVASIIACKRIIEKQPQALENFYKFLRSGNSLSPLETIKLLGIDLTKPQAWHEALAIVSEWVDQLKQELNKIKF